MSNTLKLGNGKWATGKDTLLAYNDENNNFKPLPFSFSRGTNATVVNEQGLIELVGSDEPRIDFKDNTKGSLLLEPQRSNLVTYSQDFSDAYWIKGGSSVVSGFVSPKGDASAFKLVEGTNTGVHDIIARTIGITAASVYSFSIYGKIKERNRIRMVVSNSGGTSGGFYASFDLLNGVAESINAYGVATANTSSIELFDGGFYKCTIIGVPNNTSVNTIVRTETDSGAESYTGNGTSGVYIYGAQLEQGSYATSYIPTNGSAVTRVGDVCNNGANEQVINSTEGVLYVEANLINGYDTNNWLGIIYDSSNANNRIYIQRYLGNIQVGIRVNGVIQSEITESSSSLGKNKIAFSYKLNEFKMFVNGSQVGITITSGSVFTPNTLDKCNVGVYHNNTLNFNNVINDFRLYNTALTDQQLIALTTI